MKEGLPTHGIEGMGYEGWGTGYDTEYGVKSFEYGVWNTEYRVWGLVGVWEVGTH